MAHLAELRLRRPPARARPGRQPRPERLGLYDVGGNVWEWVWDGYAPYLTDRITRDPTGPGPLAERRIIRGGSWDSRPEHVRAANRGETPLDDRQMRLGFRLARTLP